LTSSPFKRSVEFEKRVAASRRRLWLQPFRSWKKTSVAFPTFARSARTKETRTKEHTDREFNRTFHKKHLDYMAQAAAKIANL